MGAHHRPWHSVKLRLLHFAFLLQIFSKAPLRKMEEERGEGEYFPLHPLPSTLGGMLQRPVPQVREL